MPQFETTNKGKFTDELLSSKVLKSAYPWSLGEWILPEYKEGKIIRGSYVIPQNDQEK